VKACIRALDEGVRKAHIIDGRVSHALLLEIFTARGIGTEILGAPTPEGGETKE
jgi:acetylglutamate kinase